MSRVDVKRIFVSALPIVSIPKRSLGYSIGAPSEPERLYQFGDLVIAQLGVRTIKMVPSQLHWPGDHS